MPKLSVVIPLYNKAREIEATLRGVFSQTFTDFEVLVINDGSTDKSEEKVLAFNDSRLQYISTKNQGVSKARNLGIDKATTDLIAFLDADDLWLPHHLQDLIDLYQDFPKAGLFAKNYRLFFTHNKSRTPVFYKIDENFRGIVPDFFASSVPNRLALTSAVAVPKKVLQSLNGFDAHLDVGSGEDTDLWIRIALNYPVAFDASPSVKYNEHSSNKLSIKNNQNKQFPTFEKFISEEANNRSLKRFLDQYRLEYALKQKLAGNNKAFYSYSNQIDKTHLYFTSKLLLRTPRFLLMIFYRVKKFIERVFLVDLFRVK